MRHFAIIACFALAGACGNRPEGQFDETQEGFFTAAAIEGVDTAAMSPADQDLYHHVGLSILVEQYTAENLATMRTAIKLNPPAGVVFWNGNKIGAPQLASVTQAYIQAGKSAAKAQPTLLMSTDYEGGGLSKALSGKSVAGIQRFRSGFTDLPHGQWLGLEIDRLGTTRLCELHGEIMGKELMAVGINYPLATVADYAGGLFVNRGISRNPRTIAKCLEKITENFHRATGGNAIFVTKHFPGLGFTKGDTHEITVTSPRRGKDFENNLFPFKELTKRHAETRRDYLLSIMVGHAQFTAYSPNRTSTESSVILSDVLKQSKSFTEQDSGAKYSATGIGLKGFALSDAMWMGVYGFVHQMAAMGKIDGDVNGRKLEDLQEFLVANEFFTQAQVTSLKKADYQRVYNVLSMNSILAGMDLLMLPNYQFARVVEFLRTGVADKWSAEEKRLIKVRTGLTSSHARVALKKRLSEIIALNRAIRSRLASPPPYSGVTPKAEGLTLAQELMANLKNLSPIWN